MSTHRHRTKINSPLFMAPKKISDQTHDKYLDQSRKNRGDDKRHYTNYPNDDVHQGSENFSDESSNEFNNEHFSYGMTSNDHVDGSSDHAGGNYGHVGGHHGHVGGHHGHIGENHIGGNYGHIGGNYGHVGGIDKNNDIEANSSNEYFSFSDESADAIYHQQPHQPHSQISPQHPHQQISPQHQHQHQQNQHQHQQNQHQHQQNQHPHQQNKHPHQQNQHPHQQQQQTSQQSGGKDFEHIGGADDSYNINGEYGPFVMHRDALRRSLTELKSQSNVLIRNLSAHHKKIFDDVVETTRVLNKSQALYDLVLADIRTVFCDIADMRPGTVGAFFCGCFSPDKFNGPMGCSPKCTASLTPTEGTPGYNNCDDGVFLYKDGTFTALNEKRSPHIYVYLSDPHFVAFKPINIVQLKDAGVEYATLFYTHEDGSYKDVTNPIPIDKLPVSTDNVNPLNEEGVIIVPPPNETTYNNTAAIVVGVLVGILIIIAIAVLIYISMQE